MQRFVLIGTIAALGQLLQAQTIHVRGKVSNSAGQPVDKAVIELAKQGLKDTTGPDGGYSLSKTGTGVRTLPPAEGMTLSQGRLELALAKPATVTVEVFDPQGHLLRMESLPGAAAGVYRWDLEASAL